MKEIGRKPYVGSDGKSYTVCELAPTLDVKPLDGPRVSGLGTSVFRLADGGLLYDRDNDMFEIASTGVTISPV